MTNTSLNLRNDLPDDQIRLFKLISDVFAELDIEYLLVGAKSRDLLMEYCFNIPSPRATLDTDLGIMIENWKEFEKIKNYFVEHYDFATKKNVAHRFTSDKYGIVDLIPFGQIEDNNHVTFPPEYSTILSTLGFQDAFNCAVDINLDSTTSIKTASLPGLAILKLIAWSDRKHNSKDAQDLAFIISNYINAGNLERFFNDHNDLVHDDFDYEIANAQLLSRDIKKASSIRTLETVSEILNYELNESDQGHLINAISTHFTTAKEPFTKAAHMLRSVLQFL